MEFLHAVLRIFWRSVRVLLNVSLSLVLLAVVLASIGLVWVFYYPVRADGKWLRLDEFVNSQLQDWSIDTRKPELIWSEKHRQIAVRFESLKIYERETGALVAAYDEGQASFSLKKLLKGEFLPDKLSLDQAKIFIDLESQNLRAQPAQRQAPLQIPFMRLCAPGSQDGVSELIVQHTLLDLSNGMPEGSSLILQDAHFALSPEGVRIAAKAEWTLRFADSHYQVNFENIFIDCQSREGFVTVSGVVELEDLTSLSPIAGAIMPLPEAGTMLLPEGEVEFDFLLRIQPETKTLELSATASHFSDTQMRLEWRAPNWRSPLRNAEGALRISGEFLTLTQRALVEFFPSAPVIQADMELTAGWKTDDAAQLHPVNFALTSDFFELLWLEQFPLPLPMEGLHIAGTVDGRKVQIAKLEAGLIGGARLQGRMQFDFLEQEIACELDFEAKSVDSAALRSYWPVSLFPAARNWVLTNIPEALAESSALQASLRLRAGSAPEVEDLQAAIRVREGKVRYFSGLPPARNVSAELQLGLQGAAIEIKQAMLAGGLEINSGRVDLRFPNAKHPRLAVDIALPIAGPGEEILALLAHPRLDFFSSLRLPWWAFTGTLGGELALEIQAGKGLPPEISKFSASGRVENLFFEDPKILNLALRQGIMTFELTQSGMRAHFETLLRDAARLRALVPERFADSVRLAGSVGLKAALEADFRTGGFKSDIEAELTQTDWRIGPEGSSVQKNQGETASAKGRVSRANAESPIQLEANLKSPQLDISAEARAASAPEHSLSARAHFLGPGLNDFVLEYRSAEGKTEDILVSGAILDAQPFLGSQGQNGASRDIVGFLLAMVSSPPAGEEISRRILADLGQIRVRDSLTELAARIETAGSALVLVEALASTDGKAHSLRLTGTGSGRRLQVNSDDLGRVLLAIGGVSSLQGGRLRLNGQAGNAPMEGDMQIEELILANPSAILKLNELFSIRGSLNALLQDGLSLKRVEAQYALHPERLEIASLNIHSRSLGALMRGELAAGRPNQLALEGAAWPNDGVTKLLRAIPIFGSVIVGGKEDGFLATRFSLSGPVDALELERAPLTVLEPGFIKILRRRLSRDAQISSTR